MRMLLLFLLGFLLAPLGDVCHILSDTIIYPPGVYNYYIFGILPYWVPFLFGTATVLIGASHLFSDKLFDFKLFLKYGSTNPPWWHIGLGMFAFLFLYCISGIAPYWVMMLVLVYLLATLARGPYDLVLMSATALVGASAEIHLISQNLFSYHPDHRHIFGIPMWLPLLYALASLVVGNLARKLSQVDIMALCGVTAKNAEQVG